MASRANVVFDVHLEPDGAPEAMADEVVEGLTSERKRLPSKYFYDEQGSRLFDRITRLPEYYLTRNEVALLERHAPRIAELTGVEELVELGSGTEGKIRLLIEAGLAAGSLRRYVPVEVSQDVVERSAKSLSAKYPELAIHALIGDFEASLSRVPDGGRRVVVFLGSTIGNFREIEAAGFLTKVRRILEPGDWLLLGADLVKSRAALEAAYNDSEGVTAAFNRNILSVINNLADGNFDPEAFEHVAVYNDEAERIESGLRSTRAQKVRLGSFDLEVSFEKGELLDTEVSCKYTKESMKGLLRSSGLELAEWITDEDETFALALARRAPLKPRIGVWRPREKPGPQP